MSALYDDAFASLEAARKRIEALRDGDAQARKIVELEDAVKACVEEIHLLRVEIELSPRKMLDALNKAGWPPK